MKSRIVAVILLIAVIVTLVSPWYPVVTSHSVEQTFTYTYQVPTQSYQSQHVYSLPNSLTLVGFYEKGATVSTDSYTSDTFSLQVGSIVHVSVVDCYACSLVVFEGKAPAGLQSTPNKPNPSSPYSLVGSGDGLFIVPKSDIYDIVVSNFGTYEDTVTSIELSADVPQNSMQTNTGYETVAATQYSVTAAPPYSLLGTMLSLAIIIGLSLIVIFLMLIDMGIIQISKGKRRRK